MAASSPTQAEPLAAIPGVEQVLPVMRPFKLASREMREEDSSFMVGRLKIGNGALAMIAGPCAVESFEVLHDIAGKVKLLPSAGMPTNVTVPSMRAALYACNISSGRPTTSKL